MSNLILALSGASYSGKTTKMKEIKSLYKDRVIFSDEVIRDKKIDIKEIRSNAKDYLNFEIEVISKKIENDKKLCQDAINTDKILLMDRSIFDSMTYFYLYGKITDLDDIDLKRFSDFDQYLHGEVVPFYNQTLNGILMFTPLKIDENILKKDNYRQTNLFFLQNSEFNMINTLTKALFNKKVEYVNAMNWKIKEKDIFSFNWNVRA